MSTTPEPPEKRRKITLAEGVKIASKILHEAEERRRLRVNEEYEENTRTQPDPGWVPIDLAPKDGTEFQGWLSCSARWVPRMRWGLGSELWEHHAHDRWILLYPQYVTHWQPLPLPPPTH